MAAGRIEPRHANPVALPDGLQARTDSGHSADAVVAWDEWRWGFDRPVAARGMEVCVAHPTGIRLHQNLTGIR